MEAGFAVFTARFTPDFRQVVFQVEIKRQKEKKNVLDLASGVFFEFKKSEIWKIGLCALWTLGFSTITLWLQQVCLKSFFPFWQYT